MVETGNELRPDEAVLTAAFRKLTPEARRIVLEAARSALSGQAGQSAINETKAKTEVKGR